MSNETKKTYNRTTNDISELLNDADMLLKTSDLYAEKGDTEKCRAYILQSSQKVKEAFELLKNDIVKLI